MGANFNFESNQVQSEIAKRNNPAAFHVAQEIFNHQLSQAASDTRAFLQGSTTVTAEPFVKAVNQDLKLLENNSAAQGCPQRAADYLTIQPLYGYDGQEDIIKMTDAFSHRSKTLVTVPAETGNQEQWRYQPWRNQSWNSQPWDEQVRPGYYQQPNYYPQPSYYPQASGYPQPNYYPQADYYNQSNYYNYTPVDYSNGYSLPPSTAPCDLAYSYPNPHYRTVIRFGGTDCPTARAERHRGNPLQRILRDTVDELLR